MAIKWTCVNVLGTIAIQNEHLFFCKLVCILHSSIIHDSYTNTNESGQSLQNASRKSKIEEIIPNDNSIRHFLVCNGSRTAKTNETAKVGHTMFYLCFIRLERVDRVFYYAHTHLYAFRTVWPRFMEWKLWSRFIIVRTESILSIDPIFENKAISTHFQQPDLISFEIELTASAMHITNIPIFEWKLCNGNQAVLILTVCVKWHYYSNKMFAFCFEN